jgi:hypothetical protein
MYLHGVLFQKAVICISSTVATQISGKPMFRGRHVTDCYRLLCCKWSQLNVEPGMALVLFSLSLSPWREISWKQRSASIKGEGNTVQH